MKKILNNPGESTARSKGARRDVNCDKASSSNVGIRVRNSNFSLSPLTPDKLKLGLRTPNRVSRLQWLAALAMVIFVLSALRADAQTAQSMRDADKANPFMVNAAAAEAATEKVFAQIATNVADGDFSTIVSNFSLYTNLVPQSTDDPNWTNFVFFNPGNGVANSVQIGSPTYSVGTGTGLFQGMPLFQSTVRVLAGAKSATDGTGTYAAQAQLDVTAQYAPIFGFAIFYNGLLEFSDTAPLTINGRVHANSDIYTGTVSSSFLTFNSLVTTTGSISSPANAGFLATTWTGPITYNGSPSPGYQTNMPPITLPSSIAANPQQILYLPNAAQDSNTIQQLYYTKAHLVLIISNNTFTVIFKSSPIDPSPCVFVNNLNILTNHSWVTNQAIQNTSNWGTNWGWNWNWLTLTNTMVDQREILTMNIAQIDIGLLNTWMNTWLTARYNTNVNGKFGPDYPFDLIYIADLRYTNRASGILSAVRLINGSTLPTNGLTIATPNPLYIVGNYNTAGNQNLLTTNTTLCVPASLACDALTLLSSAWNDANSAKHYSSGSVADAASDTVNTAILAGNVPSTGTSSTSYSGGVQNLPRLLEDWSSATLALNTSFVCLFPSTWATGSFELPGLYYSAPVSRKFSFDQNLLSVTRQPPGAPNLILPITRTSKSYSIPLVSP